MLEALILLQSFLSFALFKFIIPTRKPSMINSFWITIQSSPAISNSEGTGQKVRDSAIFEKARLQDNVITLGENSR